MHLEYIIRQLAGISGTKDVGTRYISSDENCYTDKKTRQFRQCTWNTLSDSWLVSHVPGCGHTVQMKIITLIRKHVSSDNAFGIHYQTDGWYLRDQDVGTRYKFR